MTKLFRGVVSQYGEPEILFPVVESVQPTAPADGASSHSFSLPSGVSAGNLILAFWNGASNVAYTANSLSGFTDFHNSTQGNLRARAAYRVATGSEGSSVTASFSSFTRFSGVMFRISRYTGTPAIGGVVGSTSTTPNPGSLTHGLDSDKVLWLAVSHSAAGGSISYPSSYSSGVSAYTGIFNSFHARTSIARRELETASEDPGSFNIGNSLVWRAYTVAIMGAAE